MTLLRYLPRFRQAYRAIDELARHERFMRSEIEALQLERLNGVWRQAIERVPYYGRLAADQQLPRQFSSLDQFRERVPLLSKAQVRERGAEMLSRRRVKGFWKLTSGSTGSPTRVFWEVDAHREMLRAGYRMRQSWGLDVFEPTVFLWGQANPFARGLRSQLLRWRQPVLDFFRNRLRVPAYQLGPEQAWQSLRRIADFRPSLLYAYSSAAYVLAREAEAAGVQLDTLKLVVLSSEPAYPHLVRAVEAAFGVPAVNEYGSVECGFLAGEIPDRTLRVREDNVLLETIPRAEGRYDIVVSVLNNPSFPLLRYCIGDVTEEPLQKPDAGFAVMKNVMGRTNDLLVTRGGQFVHPFFIDDLMEAQPDLNRWQVHQQADGSVSVALECKSPTAQAQLDRIGQIIRQRLEGFPVHVHTVPRIPKTDAGKHRWIISDLLNQ